MIDALMGGVTDPLILVGLILAALLAGFVDSIVGGGGLILIPAILIGLPAAPVTTALATNKFAALFGTTTAAITYQRKYRTPARQLLPYALLAGALSVFGALTASSLDPAILRPIIIVAIIAVAIFLLARPQFGKEPERSVATFPRLIATFVMIGAIGFYDGFFGPGTGMFLIITLSALLGASFLESASTAKVINCATNVGALAVFMTVSHVIWGLAVILALANVCGAFIGSRLVLTKGTALIRIGMFAIISVLVVKLLIDQFS